MSATVEAMPQFSQERLAEIKLLVARYPHPKSALLPVLHLAQEDFGFLSEDVQRMVSEILGIGFMAVREVVTFYTMFRERPCGKYLLEVCTNAGCMLNGANELLRHMCDQLGIQPGETTADGLFTVTEVECAGACGGAPVLQINNEYHEKVNADHFDSFLEEARSGSLK